VKLLPGAPRRLSSRGEMLNQVFNLSVFVGNMVVREHAVVTIQPTIPTNIAALAGCGVMTSVGAVFNAAKLEPGSTVAMVGCGDIGLSAVNGATPAGASHIVAIDTVASKLARAKEMSATETINASHVETLEPVKELTEGAGVAFFFEAIGLNKTAEQCSAVLPPGGVATIVGLIPIGTKIELRRADFPGDRKIQGTGMGGNRFRVDMPRLLESWWQVRLSLDMLICGTIKLEEINAAFAKLKPSAPAKQLMDFGVA